MLRQPLCKITSKLVNVPVKLGSWNITEGLDCFTLMITFLDEFGYDVEDFKDGTVKVEHNGSLLDSTNYSIILKTIPEMQEVLQKTIRQEFEKVDKLKQGYICFSQITDYEVVTIYLGNKKHLSMFENYGSKIVTISNDKVKEIFRCRKLAQL
jgi:hypothetical protein